MPATAAILATVVERLKNQDESSKRMHEENKVVLKEILAQAKVTNGRVTALEQKWIYAFGFIGGFSGLAMVLWAVFVHFTK